MTIGVSWLFYGTGKRENGHLLDSGSRLLAGVYNKLVKIGGSAAYLSSVQSNLSTLKRIDGMLS